MFPYVFVAGSLALMAVAMPDRKVNLAAWGTAFVGLAIFVGLRHHVGMDWNNYLGMIYRASGGGITEALRTAEPSYAILLWVAGEMGIGIYGPNLVVAIILMAGLFRYARSTPSPWLAILAATPFLLVVTAMSANRQAAAIGILLWGIANWQQRSIIGRAAIVLLAASFHASAVMFLMFVVADLRVNRFLKLAGLGVLGLVTAYILVATDKVEYYDKMYGSGQAELTQSSGALFHVLINAGPALVYYAMPRYRRVLLPNDIHRHMALLAVGLIFVSFVASAAAGRAALYLFPVSMHVAAAMPAVLSGSNSKFLYRCACAGFFTFILIFWLIASNTGVAYVPYENVLTVDPWMLQLCC